MTARLVTTFGAVALGLAAFAVSPVMAQGAGGGGGNAPSGTATTTNAGAGHPGPAGNATNNGNPATTGTMGQGMVRPMHHGHMASAHPHHMEHHASMRSHGRMGAADSGDAAVNQLNEQSLMAAQKGTNFTPSGTQQ